MKTGGGKGHTRCSVTLQIRGVGTTRLGRGVFSSVGAPASQDSEAKTEEVCFGFFKF